MGEKPDFSGDFQRPNLTMREIWGVKSFPQALISNGLEIICKVSRRIYTPVWYRGVGGVGLRREVFPTNPISYCAAMGVNYLQTICGGDGVSPRSKDPDLGHPAPGLMLVRTIENRISTSGRTFYREPHCAESAGQLRSPPLRDRESIQSLRLRK